MPPTVELPGLGHFTHPDQGFHGAQRRVVPVQRKEAWNAMLLALAVILVVAALAGGIAVNPVLFLIALLALVIFLGGERRGTAL
jgi:hypothetical protein